MNGGWVKNSENLGLPPLLGFLPKWIVIQSIINNSSILIISTIVILSLITSYYYLRISYSAFINDGFSLRVGSHEGRCLGKSRLEQGCDC